eukprot:gene15199-21913_t
MPGDGRAALRQGGMARAGQRPGNGRTTAGCGRATAERQQGAAGRRPRDDKACTWRCSAPLPALAAHTW